MKFILFSMLMLVAAATPICHAESPKTWQDGKITPEQPFAARIIGVNTSWVGVTVLLESTNSPPKKYLIADIHANAEQRIVYRECTVAEKDHIVKDAKKGELAHWNIIAPGVRPCDFSWGSLYTIGRAFGEKDLVHKKWKYQNQKTIREEQK